jgi:uncharacterized iron-regulated membrane protein
LDKKRAYVKSLRKYRVFHRYIGITLAALLLISAITGFLLGWKKDVDLIQPPTQKGVSKDIMTWKPMHEIATLAENTFYEKYPEQVGNKINKMDARPSKGIIKVLFKKGYWEVQIDATSGEVKSIKQRHSDWIESIHDGSIISDTFKLISMNLLGIGLTVLSITGFWLWYGPKLIRAIKRKKI